ncbi:MAG: hypothetical protein HYR85_08155 [Planctomycetes bacterium]|nr:hypothetical protein [Planctomycetota bacterium]MBI3843240.1 hypothetical protein [Planctomycetota bacterium]
MMRTTDGTIGLMIANAADHGRSSLAHAEKFIEILETIGDASQEEIDEGNPDPNRERILQHRVNLSARIRYVIWHRLKGETEADEPEAER